MNLLTHDRPPPDAAWTEPRLTPLQAVPSEVLPQGALPFDLVMPLAARALGPRRFPQLAIDDAHAARVLQGLGLDPSPYLARASEVCRVLSRTAIVRERAREFFQRHPRGLGVALGAGLSHGFQWLDTGSNHWIDADVPAVVRLRERWLPAAGRRIHADLDLGAAHWWQTLGLPSGRQAPPLLLTAEGLVMHLEPAKVRQLLATLGEQAPPGSRVLIDAVAWPMVGVRGSAFGEPLRHGLRHTDELSAAHPRLRLDGVHPVMEDTGITGRALNAASRLLFGVPKVAVYELGVDA